MGLEIGAQEIQALGRVRSRLKKNILMHPKGGSAWLEQRLKRTYGRDEAVYVSKDKGD